MEKGGGLIPVQTSTTVRSNQVPRGSVVLSNPADTRPNPNLQTGSLSAQKVRAAQMSQLGMPVSNVVATGQNKSSHKKSMELLG